MAKFKGILRKSDLEGGVWQLEADDGVVYEVEGVSDAEKLRDQRVEIDGGVDRQTMSFAMTGPRLKVRAVKKLT